MTGHPIASSGCIVSCTGEYMRSRVYSHHQSTCRYDHPARIRHTEIEATRRTRRSFQTALKTRKMCRRCVVWQSGRNGLSWLPFVLPSITLKRNVSLVKQHCIIPCVVVKVPALLFVRWLPWSLSDPRVYRWGIMSRLRLRHPFSWRARSQKSNRNPNLD